MLLGSLLIVLQLVLILVAIKGTNIYVWTADDGTWCTVTNTGTAYLTGTKQSDYHFRSIQDTTVITNRTVTLLCKLMVLMPLISRYY
jgi:hypothetical protein